MLSSGLNPSDVWCLVLGAGRYSGDSDQASLEIMLYEYWLKGLVVFSLQERRHDSAFELFEGISCRDGIRLVVLGPREET